MLFNILYSDLFMDVINLYTENYSGSEEGFTTNFKTKETNKIIETSIDKEQTTNRI